MAVLLPSDATRLNLSTGRWQQVFKVDRATQTILGSVTVGKRPVGHRSFARREDSLLGHRAVK